MNSADLHNQIAKLQTQLAERDRRLEQFEELQTQMKAIAELPEEWKNADMSSYVCPEFQCANELAAILKGKS